MIKKISLVFVLLMMITGCTTTGTFKVPQGPIFIFIKDPSR